MRLAALRLLRGGVHVAEAALERAIVEDRRRAGAVIERIDDLARLVDGPGRGEARRIIVLCARLNSPLSPTASQISARVLNRKARAERNRASPCASCDCMTWFSHSRCLVPRGIFLVASSVKSAIMPRAMPSATAATPAAYKLLLLKL
jgi:hypothetical protein